jgi:glycosyltransferase involved in cell wall biosynthesis
MILGLPVQDGHDLTRTALESLAKTVRSKSFKVVVIDNNSTEPYQKSEFADLPLRVDIIRNKKNTGYYQPLIQLHDRYSSEALIGLMHNDMLLYEEGWDERMERCFTEDDKLYLVGLCGSYEVDERGGRGGGTACFFRGEKGQSQAAGARIVGLMPSACLDSLFMMFKRNAIPALQEDWNNLPLAHFYDRIWPLKLVEQGYHVATLGVECDHMGGMTTVANPRYYDDCVTWLNERGIAYENPETEMYLVAERRYLGEFRETKRFIPCRIREDYSYERIAY